MRNFVLALGWILGLGASTLAQAAGEPTVQQLVPKVMPGDLELAVIPRPKQEAMSDRMIAAGRVAVLAPGWDDLRAGQGQLQGLFRFAATNAVHRRAEDLPADGYDTLLIIGGAGELARAAAADPEAGARWAELAGKPNADQGYYLSVQPGSPRNTVTILAPTPAGAFYAVQTLKQVAYTNAGAVHVRAGRILDWPTFAARGDKGSSFPWVYALKGNAHHAHRPLRAVAEAHFGTRWVPSIFPCAKGGSLDASSSNMVRLAAMATNYLAQGASDLRFHVDDQPMKLTPETDAAFKGDYFAALAHVIHAVYSTMKATKPDAVLFFCATPYWTFTPYEEYAQRLWAGRAPPADLAMCINGPQVTSTAVPPDEVAAYSKAFQAGRPAWIEDWHGRGDSFGPVEPRQAALAQHAFAVLSGAGTATMRATRLDWAWNPEAYDPERSLLLACREFAGFAHWKHLHRLVSALESGVPGPVYEPRDAALARWTNSLQSAAVLLGELKALPNHGLQGRIALPPREAASAPQDVVAHIEPTLNKLLTNTVPRVVREGYREAAAARAPRPPQVDGDLAEAEWAGAPDGGTFASDGRAVAPNAQTRFRCLYDDTHLYFAFEVSTPKPIDLAPAALSLERSEALGVELPRPTLKQAGHDMRGIFALGGWHAVALMLDPRHTHHTTYEFQFDAAGRRADGLLDEIAPDSPNGLAWDCDWRSAVKVTPTGWTAELAIPWSALGVSPRPGLVMGLQAWRVGGLTANWSLTPRWWGVESPRQFGHLILK